MHYIHVKDPSFAATPFPGEYRIGPFETEKHAKLQAEQERVGGKEIVGIFTAKESEARRGEDD